MKRLARACAYVVVFAAVSLFGFLAYEFVFWTFEKYSYAGPIGIGLAALAFGIIADRYFGWDRQ